MLEKFVKIIERNDAMVKQLQIASLEFDVSVEANDPGEQEKIRMKIHQLTDDTLDLRVELKYMKDEDMKRILK